MEKKPLAMDSCVRHYRLRKFLLMTKLTCVFILFFSLQSSSKGLFAQENISLHIKNENLKTVLKSIEKQSGIQFIYNDNLVLPVSIEHIDAKNQNWQEVLLPILNKAGLSIRRVNQQQYIITTAIVNNYSFTGKVIDFDGNPIADVNITEKGSSNGTKTDVNGFFKLSLTRELTSITLSSVGYEVVEVELNAKKLHLIPGTSQNSNTANDVDMVIRMRRKERVLDSLVVIVNTGYQSLSKERSTGSFSVVTGDKLAQKSGSMNVVDRLEGMAPGLAVNYGQGNDKLLMRGTSSVNLDRQPLIVVDGVPIAEYRNIESLINPQDVKDITMLKDATAASIWGAQAANGVIVITTKSGQYNNNKINISYNGFMSWKGRPDYGSLNLMSSADFIKANKELFNTADYGTAFPYSTVSTGFFPKIYPHEQVFYDQQSNAITQAQANQKWDSLAGLSNRSQVEQYFQKPGTLTAHNISLSSGGRSDRFYGSLSYNRYNNNDRSTKDRYVINLKEELKIAKWLSFDITGNMAYEKSQQLYTTLPLGLSLDTYTPYAMFADNNGNPLKQDYLNMTTTYQQTAEQNSKISLGYVPLDELQRNQNNSTSYISRVNAGLKFTLAKGLDFSTRGQYQKTIDNGYNFYDEKSYPVRLENVQFTQKPSTPGGAPTYYLPLQGGRYSTTRNTVTAWTARHQLEYNNKIGTDHQLIALAGFEMRSNKFNIVNTLTRGYNFQTQTYASFNQKDLESPGVSNPVLPLNSSSSKNTLQANPFRERETELRFLSYYGNLAYTYKSRYNFNGSIRYDQSSFFGKNSSSQNKPIWSTGLSWNLDKEDFFNNTVFSKLTPRVTYGIAGNSPKPGKGGPFDMLYAVSSPMFSGLGPGYMIISPANNALSWEETKIFNMGVDFEIVSRKISGSVDYYNKQTTDLLGDSPVDPTTGWYSYYGNIGNLSNKGIELSVTSNNISSKNFGWTTNFNIANNRNKVALLKRYTPLTPSGLVNGGFVEGYPAFSLFAYNYKGLDANGNPVAIKADGSTASLAKELTNADVLYMGTTQAPWYGGLTNNFIYNRFTLSGLIVYNLGNVMRDDVNKVYSGRLLADISNTFENRWQKPGDENSTNVPKYVPNDVTSSAQRVTDLYTKGNINVVSAAYIKLRDISLTYNIPVAGGLQNAIRSLKVYGQVNNIMIWTKNPQHIDPEYYNLSTGSRIAKMPPFYTLGVNVDF